MLWKPQYYCKLSIEFSNRQAVLHKAREAMLSFSPMKVQELLRQSWAKWTAFYHNTPLKTWLHNTATKTTRVQKQTQKAEAWTWESRDTPVHPQPSNFWKRWKKNIHWRKERATSANVPGKTTGLKAEEWEAPFLSFHTKDEFKVHQVP